jgi:hypothetical protein
MPRLNFKELRIHRKRLAKFIVVNADGDHEFARIKSTKRGVIGLNADNAAPRRMIEWNNSDRTHRGHDSGTSARDEISDIVSCSFTKNAWANDDHRAEVSKTSRKAKQLIASLKHERLCAFRGFGEKVGGKFDLDRTKHTAQ